MEYHMYPGNILQYDTTYDVRIILEKAFEKSIKILEISRSENKSMCHKTMMLSIGYKHEITHIFWIRWIIKNLYLFFSFFLCERSNCYFLVKKKNPICDKSVVLVEKLTSFTAWSLVILQTKNTICPLQRENTEWVFKPWGKSCLDHMIEVVL